MPTENQISNLAFIEESHSIAMSADTILSFNIQQLWSHQQEFLRILNQQMTRVIEQPRFEGEPEDW